MVSGVQRHGSIAKLGIGLLALGMFSTGGVADAVKGISRRSVLGSAGVASAGWVAARGRAVAQASDATPAATQSASGTIEAGDNDIVPVNLVSKIAGEDLTNDQLKVTHENVLLPAQTHEGVTIEAGATQASEPVDCAAYRQFMVMAYGDAGPITYLVQISPDDGKTWFWHFNGESESSQYPLVQTGPVVAPRCRLVITNAHTESQSVYGWLVLGR